MRDFEWNDKLFAVIKENGSFAGIPCLTFEEAREISLQHKGSHIYIMALDDNDEIDVYDDEDYEPADIDDDCGFDPYLGCFTDDC